MFVASVTGLFRSLATTFWDKIQKEDRKIYRADKRQQQEEKRKRNAELWNGNVFTIHSEKPPSIY